MHLYDATRHKIEEEESAFVLARNLEVVGKRGISQTSPKFVFIQIFAVS